MQPLLRTKRVSLPTFLVLLLVFLPAWSCSGLRNPDAVSTDDTSLEPTVVLISIDGFRWDYLDLYAPPTLLRLAAEGVRAERMIPSFPTKTFPNHYTLVTGLYPANHGIVANNMYDPVFDASFSLGNREAVEDGRWWEGEPLWVTAEKQGVKSATYFWPGSEAAIQGVRSTYWKRYDGRVPGEDRVRQVLAWLDLPPDQRPRFITLYFSEVDHFGHQSGPESEAVAEAVRNVDGYLQLLVEGLEERGIYDEVNLIITSDHGMAATSSERVILLDDYVDLNDVRIVDWNPVVMLYPDEGKEEAVLQQLSRAPHLSVYRRDEVPVRLHFRNHRRIPPIIGIADEGWSITTRKRFEENPSRFDGGTHGYDNQLDAMGALFVARGPAFGKGEVVGPFANIHVYNLMAAVLGVEPAPNDGDLGAIRHLLRPTIVSP